ncbi:MAG: ATP-binding protein [bacterium]|nr:ATP-binding protein [bacterium]
MFARTMAATLRRQALHYPVVTLTGPRQSGKTTLARQAFPDLAYANLEDPGQREYALHDPREFLVSQAGGLIIHEAQRAPDLFSYIQALVDQDDSPGRFILTGSHDFLLMRSIRQSLAGRAAVLRLLPLSLAELRDRAPIDLEQLGRPLPPASAIPNVRDNTRDTPATPGLLDTLFAGGYPQLHDKGIAPGDWLANYVRTYVERDVAEVLQVSDLEAFGRFLGLCAGRNAQLLNLTSLANDCGITHPTARSWLSVLETSYIVKLLRPHHRNFSKRLVKSAKLYFLDTGLLCYLLRIRSPEELRTHALRGAVFESFVFSELMKNQLNRGLEADLYFWRDSSGKEIDFVIDRGHELVPVEAKSAITISEDALAWLGHWQALAGQDGGPAALVYGGDTCVNRSTAAVYSWNVL